MLTSDTLNAGVWGPGLLVQLQWPYDKQEDFDSFCSKVDVLMRMECWAQCAQVKNHEHVNAVIAALQDFAFCCLQQSDIRPAYIFDELITWLLDLVCLGNAR